MRGEGTQTASRCAKFEREESEEGWEGERHDTFDVRNLGTDVTSMPSGRREAAPYPQMIMRVLQIMTNKVVCNFAAATWAESR